MKLDIVKFETAKALKEAGFDLECELNYCLESYKLYRFRLGIIRNVCAPTQALVQKWLREKHNMILTIDYGPLSQKYSYEIYHNNIDMGGEYINGTYEEALEMGISEAVKLI